MHYRYILLKYHRQVQAPGPNFSVAGHRTCQDRASAAPVLDVRLLYTELQNYGVFRRPSLDLGMFGDFLTQYTSIRPLMETLNTVQAHTGR